ncbi:hypothetical protein BC828DRAFT_378333 [Blastocladiella britannica]|nr:hypothetical protein BC828DRAFT_378333 [Blastocladiella britannica]
MLSLSPHQRLKYTPVSPSAKPWRPRSSTWRRRRPVYATTDSFSSWTMRPSSRMRLGLDTCGSYRAMSALSAALTVSGGGVAAS